MDIFPLLKTVGQAFEDTSDNFSKYKGNVRTLGMIGKDMNEGYFKLIFIEEDEVIKWDIEFKECPKNEISKEIFFMKSLPTSSGRTTLSITVDEMFRDVFGGKQSTIERVANLSQDERLLKVIKLANQDKLVHPSDWNGNINNMLKARYDELAKKYINYPITVFYNNEMLMRENKFQKLWIEEYFKVNGRNIKCSCCGTDKNVIKNGRIKWGMFTIKRKTQLHSNGNSLCRDCSNLITLGMYITEKYKIRVGKNAVDSNEYSMVIPLTYDKDKLRTFYNRLSKMDSKTFYNEFDFYNSLSFIKSEIELMDVDKILVIKYGTNEKTTFEISDIKIIDTEIFNAKNKEEMQYRFSKTIDQLGIYSKLDNSHNPYNLICVTKTDSHINKVLKETLLLLFTRPNELHENKLYKMLDKIDVLISQNKSKYKDYDKHPFSRGFNYQYQIYHYLAKGNTMEKVYNSKDYALGVLLKITHQIQIKKYKKTLTPILKKYSNSRNFDRMFADIKKFILREWETLDLYQKKIYHHALENFTTGNEMDKSMQGSVFMLGFSSENHYPEFLDKEEFWNSFKKDSKENEIKELVRL